MFPGRVTIYIEYTRMGSMVTFKGFLSIFKDTDFTVSELRIFYFSVKKSVILRRAGRRFWPEIFKLEEQSQWPVVRRIGDPNLPIYKGADKALLERFIKTIDEEKRIRARKASFDKVRYWTLLQALIDERIELFTNIFGFTEKDFKYCEMIADRYSKIVEKRIRNRKKIWTIGLGTGAATLAGAAAWYIYKKDKK
jgi:hypothetical protein